MFDPAVQTALVILVAFLINLAVHALGIPLSLELVNALAAAIVVWLLGVNGGAHVARSIRAARARG